MILNEWFRGESIGKYVTTSPDTTDNVDAHTEIGTLRCQLALSSESSTPNEPCVSANATNGDVYFFSTSTGKTWKRTAAGVYSLVNTNANGAHLGARYYNGYIYYATSTKLGRFDLASSWSDSFATFTITASYRPMEEVNLTLFIGNGKYISSVNSAGTFSDNALDLPANYQVTALADTQKPVSQLAIGTIIGTSVSECKVFIWDTYSPSWTVEDTVYEIGINQFIRADDTLFAQCGTTGQLYYWSGSEMVKFRKIKGVTTSTGYQKSAVLNGKPLLAIGTDIYSIHHTDKDLPFAINHEFTVTTGTVSSMVVSGTTLLVSNGSNIDKPSTSYATAKFVTPLLKGSPTSIEVDYESMPSGCSLALESNINGAGYVSETGFINDTTNSKYILSDGITYDGTVNFLQLRVTLTPNASATPIIQQMSIS